jgi:selenide,water dikinase
VKAATDVTGFALLGHAWEMACASKVTIEIDASAVPLLEGALELAAQGMLTSADKTNREYVGIDVEIASSLDPSLTKLLFDPQTAGGMLIAIAADKAEALLKTLNKHYPQTSIIARVLPRGPHAIIVSN